MNPAIPSSASPTPAATQTVPSVTPAPTTAYQSVPVSNVQKPVNPVAAGTATSTPVKAQKPKFKGPFVKKS